MKEKESYCNCCHSHEHKIFMNPAEKRVISIIFIGVSLIILRPFLFNQIFSRASAYMSYYLYDDAIRQYKKAILLDKYNDDAWDWLGYAYKSKGDSEKELEVYNDAIKVNPNNRKAHFNIGMIYMSNKDYDEAVKHLRYVVAMGKEKKTAASLDAIPYYRSSLRMLVICYEKMGKIDEMRHMESLLK